jgi:hypothetical protein
MSPLSTLPSQLYFLLLLTLFAVVVARLARRRALVPLFRGVRSLQVVAATRIVGISYAVLAFRSNNALPDVPKFLLTVLAVSNAIYLAPRLRSFVARRPT